jgi:hypothetical protein
MNQIITMMAQMATDPKTFSTIVSSSFIVVFTNLSIFVFDFTDVLAEPMHILYCQRQ